ncbi:uncharacterized protein LOC143906437 [Temnothorax americanus]|uniref:uncharacterized protein LOC143906437 n=1 Tax=Temnothorax americanus TaxID=1964332 RepID=UPI0040683C87
MVQSRFNGFKVELRCLVLRQIRTTPDQPRWQKTQFGWIAGGEISTRKTQSKATICNLITNEALDNAIAKFWEIEHGVRKIKMSAEDLADITKMYRQVLVDESQVSLQRILWRDTPDGPIRMLELLTVTYGTGAAAFLAIKSIRTLAEIEAKNFPIGSKIVLRDFDVDDLITGANMKEAALQVRDETTKLLEKGGFVLRKWASNSPDLLVNLPDSSMINSTRTLDKEGMCKTLGIQWNPKDDVLLYRIQINADTNQRVTKRTILSCVAQIFDPLGLLGPVIILAKMLIQRLWTLQLGWDESLPAELHTQWSNYKSQLSQLNDIRIPRRAVEVKSSTRIELHGFCDASQNAYGACIYLRTTNQRRVHTTKLLCAKSRVAPLKAVSLPRLELNAAQLLAQLTDKVVPILELKIDAVYLWTDSQIVLDWINSSSRRFNFSFCSQRRRSMVEWSIVVARRRILMA